MKKYDVVIIGAGPAGLNCAATLGDTHLKVLVLEKNAQIGPKICAGGINRSVVEYLKIPQSFIERRFNKVKLHVNTKTYTAKRNYHFLYSIDRKKLGLWQLENLKRFRNVEIRTKFLVSRIKNNFIIANGQKIYYKYLVGADGSKSITKRYLGIKPKKIGLGLQYKVFDKRYQNLEFFFNSKLFNTWCVWVFPHKDYAYIGCGANPKILNFKKLSKNFDFWLEKKQINMTNSKKECFPLDYDFQGYRFGNTFLVGDAAGLVSGLTGEGIFPALISGEEIGKIILNPYYKSERMDQILKTKRKHERILNIMINAGYFRNLFFHTGCLSLKLPFIKKKIL
jgi:geranylgeranyl reductase